jgi:hypothetical protein
MDKKWDVFISHASEDKATVAEPIAQFLSSVGVKVWYDNFTLSVGDSLSRSIDKGLAESRFGLVILSPSFFSKDWPEYELRGLVAKELGRDKVILPIWHNVSKDDVLQYSPPLADKLALMTASLSPDEIGLRVLAIVRPDIMDFIHARFAYQKMVESGRRVNIEMKKLKPSPVRRETLPEHLVRRIRLVRAALLYPHPMTMDLWMDGFKRDMHPEQELAFWEHIAACYLEYITLYRLSPEQHKAAFWYLFATANGDGPELARHATLLPPDSLELLRDNHQSSIPVYDVKDMPKTFDDIVSMSDEKLTELRKAYATERA